MGSGEIGEVRIMKEEGDWGGSGLCESVEGQ